ncbi:MAG: hypothetical protein J0665_13780 [Deltaproteobacteria bacterium]|nr:hypothetical protein [Deltaproteobacteria bacterium]
MPQLVNTTVSGTPILPQYNIQPDLIALLETVCNRFGRAVYLYFYTFHLMHNNSIN